MTVKIYRFTAGWCKPCKALSEVLANENLNIKNVVDIETPEAKELMAKYNIRSVPTIIIDYGTNHEPDRIVGFPMSNFHKELLREWLTRENTTTH